MTKIPYLNLIKIKNFYKEELPKYNMVGVISQISTELTKEYETFLSIIPPQVQGFIGLFILSLIVVIYSVFIWKFYRFTARKNLITLNLNQYNTSQHPFFVKFFAGGFYFLEYIIILPFLVLFWYVIFTLFLLFLTEGLTTSSILLISATIIASVRLTAYYKEDVAKEIAKLLPYTLLGIAITKPGFFDVIRVINQFKEIPVFFSHIFIYVLFIFIIEVVLRAFDLVLGLFNLTEGIIEKEE
jgi:hypothetical protein